VQQIQNWRFYIHNIWVVYFGYGLGVIQTLINAMKLFQ